MGKISGKSKVLEFYFEHDGIQEWFENKTVKYGDGFVVTFSLITKQKELQLHLEKRVKQEVEKNEQNQRILFQQSKLAEMGTMLHMIAHQWRQPLNTLTLLFNIFIKKSQKNSLSWDEKNDLKESFFNQIDYMSKTIDDFSSFFKPSYEKSTFEICDVVDETISLLQASLRNEKIDLQIDCQQSLECFGYKNELKQVLLNLMNNSKDSLSQVSQKEKYIKISTYKQNQTLCIEIEDNGEGIKKDIVENIFDPYFSTKTEKNGTGLGLYMSKVIIQEHMDGTLSIESTKQPTRFLISLKN
jgi:C4-dicarboxylate-specific signal transduction histidine kinase